MKWKSEFSSKAHCSCLAISKKLACRVRASRISFMSFLSVVSVAKLATVVCLFRGLGLKLTWLLFINKTPLSSESPSPSLLRLRFHQGHVFLQYYPYVHFIAECLRADILHVQSRAIFEPDAFCTPYAVRAGDHYLCRCQRSDRSDELLHQPANGCAGPLTRSGLGTFHPEHERLFS